MRRVLLLLASLVAPVALGATFVVTDEGAQPDVSPGDGECLTAAATCTLPAAMMEANALAGLDRIEIPPGTYDLVLPPITSELELVGLAPDRPRLRAMRIQDGASAHFQSLDFPLLGDPLLPPAPPCTLKVPLTVSGANLEAVDCLFSAAFCPSVSVPTGPSIRAALGAELVLRNCSVVDHDVIAVEVTDSTAIIEDSVFEENAGSVRVGNGHLEIRRSTLGTTGDPLDVLVFPGLDCIGSTVVLEDLTMDAAAAPAIKAVMGAIELSQVSVGGATDGDYTLDLRTDAVALEDVTLIDSAAWRAAVRIEADSVMIQGLTIGPRGGVMLPNRRALIVEARDEIDIRGLDVSGQDGDFPPAVELDAPIVRLREAVIHDVVTGYDDVVAIRGTESLLIADSAFLRLGAGRDQLRLESADGLLANVTMTGGTAERHAVHVAGGTVRLIGVTIARNVAGTAALGPRGGSELSLDHSLVGDNRGGPDRLGTVLVDGPSLLESPGTCVVDGDPGLLIAGAAPLFLPLRHDGSALASLAPAPTSPATDAGLPDCSALAAGLLALDQRGTPRPLDGDGEGSAACDLGAVETDPTADDDEDGVSNGTDNCPADANPDQADEDGNGVGDACQAPPEPSAFRGGSLPETPLLVSREGADSLRFDWQLVDADVHHLMRGPLDGVAEELPLEAAACGLTEGFATTDLRPGENLFFLVEAETDGLHSSLGRTSFGAERGAASRPCP